jgi:hypothetical protein
MSEKQRSYQLRPPCVISYTITQKLVDTSKSSLIHQKAR